MARLNQPRSSYFLVSQLDYGVRLLLHYNKTPSSRAVPPPANRTAYAAEHLMRKLKAKYAGDNHGDGAEDLVVPKTHSKKQTAKTKTPKRKATEADEGDVNEQNASLSKKAKVDVIRDEAEI